ncbi:hypothetical protein BZA05DRAFT_434494 [Tricharina praecox]|uniref:uncharacterized protein n=1 Tax=Tricharina praecox TaxID=43433 RepID=UPI00221F87F3|nr:uncharacterized protein BZA05DRAFT_434494 [Tricharina praecox]KAI5856077.1 hypothetical protein BZA05DRAFT_434494 [Tricharina praecox]
MSRQKLSESWWAVGSQYWDTSGSVRPSAATTDCLNIYINVRQAPQGAVIRWLSRGTTR